VKYFDTSYLVRLYLQDPGWQEVRKLAATDHLACCLHGRAEAVAAFHRKLREGAINTREWRVICAQFETDCGSGAFHWLALSTVVVARLGTLYARLSPAVALRAADGIHLACAAENGFNEVYSHDARLLAAAPHFGLKGVDILPPIPPS